MRTTRCRSRKSARGACDSGLVSMGPLPLRPMPQCAGAAARRPVRCGRSQCACVRALVRGSIRRKRLLATKPRLCAVAHRYDSHKDQILRGGTCENISLRQRDCGAGKATGRFWRRRQTVRVWVRCRGRHQRRPTGRGGEPVAILQPQRILWVWSGQEGLLRRLRRAVCLSGSSGERPVARARPWTKLVRHCSRVRLLPEEHARPSLSPRRPAKI
jgi:hypothetical protein